MALKFNCENCSSIIYSKFLKIGEGSKCKNCGSVTTIPENAEIISESDIPEKLDNSEKHDNGPTQIKSNIKDKKSELKNGSGYKGKANSPFFEAVEAAAVILCIFQFICIFLLVFWLKEVLTATGLHWWVTGILIAASVVLPICGIIVSVGFTFLIGVVKGLEKKMDIPHQEKNNG